MFESLGDRLQNAIDKIKGYGKITEENISDITREIRLALLEADVNYVVVKEFINHVKEKALGEEVAKSLKPGEVFVKIVKDELVELLGGEKQDLYTSGNPSILMMVGLQGSGKTTSTGKLANLLRKKYKKRPLLVACDIYRPAAIDQLKQLGRELNIEVYSEGVKDPVEIASNAILYAKENHYDYVLIDTAGRLQIDEKLMMSEKVGHRSFYIWGKLLLKCGQISPVFRQVGLYFYIVFLIILILTVVPLSAVVKRLLKPLLKEKLARQRRYFAEPSGE